MPRLNLNNDWAEVAKQLYETSPEIVERGGSYGIINWKNII